MEHTGKEPGTPSIDGCVAFQAALKQAFADLADSSCREVWLCDRNYAEWPLSDAATLAQLTQWALPHRRLVVLAADFDSIGRHHPRWVAWRRRWDHVVACRIPSDTDADSIPCLFLAPPHIGIELHDAQKCRGTRAASPSEMVRMRSEVDAYLQRSSGCFPATQLGL